jgi:hypothetical protein
LETSGRDPAAPYPFVINALKNHRFRPDSAAFAGQETADLTRTAFV